MLCKKYKEQVDHINKLRIEVGNEFVDFRYTAYTLLAEAEDLIRDLEERLYMMATQHKCGCMHPNCNRCEDDTLNKELLERAKAPFKTEMPHTRYLP